MAYEIYESQKVSAMHQTAAEIFIFLYLVYDLYCVLRYFIFPYGAGFKLYLLAGVLYSIDFKINFHIHKWRCQTIIQ